MLHLLIGTMFVGSGALALVVIIGMMSANYAKIERALTRQPAFAPLPDPMPMRVRVLVRPAPRMPACSPVPLRVAA
jgi:hypothetical protein